MDRSQSRARRKRAATKDSSSRCAGAISRTSDGAWQLGQRNLVAQAASLTARMRAIRRRLAVPVGHAREEHGATAMPQNASTSSGTSRSCRPRLSDVQERLGAGRVSVCRGGQRLAWLRHHLEDAGLSRRHWQERWRAARWFICADGEAHKARSEGREHTGRRPSRGRGRRRSRALVAGIPTARFRDRLIQMAANRALSVIAVDLPTPQDGARNTGVRRASTGFTRSQRAP